MSMTALIDTAIGETRACVFDDKGAPLQLLIERPWEAQTRALAHAIYYGRVTHIDEKLNAGFIDLGLGKNGFLPFGKQGRPANVHEGVGVAVRVRCEAHDDKGPLLALHEHTPAANTPCPSLLSAAPPLAQLLARTGSVKDADAEARKRLDALIDDALNPVVSLPGGGDIAIEPTRALIAIDVDTGSGNASADAVNIAAIPVIMRQLSLRNLGGIIAIDFAPMRAKKIRQKVENLMQIAVRNDPVRMQLSPMNKIGVTLFTRQREGRSLAQILCDHRGRKSVATCALEAMRALENTGRAEPGRPLVLQTAQSVFDWLDDAPFDWRTPMKDRLGGRFTLTIDPALARDQYEVISQ